MAEFTPKKIELNKINNGQRFRDGDGVSPDAINAPIEAAAYAQDLSERAFDFAKDVRSDINYNSKRIENLEASLSDDAFISDSSVAYQKSIPVGVAPYATIDKIGGMTYKSENFFDIDKFIALPNNAEYYSKNANGELLVIGYDTRANTALGAICTLAAGTYYLDSNVTSGMEIINADSGETIAWNCFFSIAKQTSIAIKFVSATQINVGLVQLVKGSTKPTEYNPYFEGLRHTKAKAIESKGANEFTDSARIYSNYQYISAYMVFTFDGLIPNSPYTISLVNGYKGNAESHTEKYVNLSNKSFEPINSGVLGWLVHPNETYCNDLQTVTSSAEGKLYLRLYGYNDQTQLSELFSICTNIMLNIGESAFPYTPYSAEPIDTFTIPEAVQALDGYGEGSSEDNYNYIEKTDDERWLFHNGDNITDITDLMPSDNYIKVEGGGTIIAENEYEYAVPTTITYQKRG